MKAKSKRLFFIIFTQALLLTACSTKYYSTELNNNNHLHKYKIRYFKDVSKADVESIINIVRKTGYPQPIYAIFRVNKIYVIQLVDEVESLKKHTGLSGTELKIIKNNEGWEILENGIWIQ